LLNRYIPVRRKQIIAKNYFLKCSLKTQQKGTTPTRKHRLRIIIGNPPYSVGQKSANDNAQNQSYPKLDGDIAKSYAKLSSAGLNKSLYDAYIKAFRWSTDRLDPKNGGIICFVSNGGWLEGNSTDGFRKSLEKNFHLFIFLIYEAMLIVKVSLDVKKLETFLVVALKRLYQLLC
jgi:predicted helicase